MGEVNVNIDNKGSIRKDRHTESSIDSMGITQEIADKYLRSEKIKSNELRQQMVKAVMNFIIPYCDLYFEYLSMLERNVVQGKITEESAISRAKSYYIPFKKLNQNGYDPEKIVDMTKTIIEQSETGEYPTVYMLEQQVKRSYKENSNEENNKKLQELYLRTNEVLDLIRDDMEKNRLNLEKLQSEVISKNTSFRNINKDIRQLQEDTKKNTEGFNTQFKNIQENIKELFERSELSSNNKIQNNSTEGENELGVQKNPTEGENESGVQKNPIEEKSESGVQKNPIEEKSESGVQKNPTEGKSESGVQKNPIKEKSYKGEKKWPFTNKFIGRFKEDKSNDLESISDSKPNMITIDHIAKVMTTKKVSKNVANAVAKAIRGNVPLKDIYSYISNDEIDEALLLSILEMFESQYEGK